MKMKFYLVFASPKEFKIGEYTTRKKLDTAIKKMKLQKQAYHVLKGYHLEGIRP